MAKSNIYVTNNRFDHVQKCMNSCRLVVCDGTFQRGML